MGLASQLSRVDGCFWQGPFTASWTVVARQGEAAQRGSLAVSGWLGVLIEKAFLITDGGWPLNEY